MRHRIQTLDGLRFLAALGVLWIHIWTAYGNPRWRIGNFDVTNLLAIGGNGVDLFFVISGFCMYLFYGVKSNFSYNDFYKFILKRWIRLSPAFYCSTIIYIVVNRNLYQQPSDYVLSFITSVFYLNSIIEQKSAAYHFWTLGVEWQFYFLIPFLLIYQFKNGFKKVFGCIFGIICLLGLVLTMLFKDLSDLLTNQIFFRGIEFGAGIIAARLLVKDNSYFRNRAVWLIVFIVITYIGRIFISKQFLAMPVNHYNIFKLVGFTIMSLGFSGIVYMAVTSDKWLNYFLGNVFFKNAGRISYSFYLWHVLIFPIVVNYVNQFFVLLGIFTPILATTISLLILYPISHLSYAILEKPFLSMGNLSTK